MKTKDQILWEEKSQLELLMKSKPLLTLETDLVIKTVCVNYLIYSHELNRNFAIIKSKDKQEKQILESFGYRTLQTNEIHIPTIDFLIDYIFRY